MVPNVTSPVNVADDSVVDFLYNLDAINLNESDRNQTENTPNQNDTTNKASIFNLTANTLDKSTVKLLEKGLKFVPTPTSINKVEFQADLDRLSDKVKFKSHKRLRNNDGTSANANSDIPVVKPSFIRPAWPSNDPTVTSACQKNI